ncbi:MAG: tautomerase family protein [Thermoanaerobacteraceae bacterium]|nr:tautomerase family protein [Thermoanaerobacteraceae bacterium]
MPAVTITMRTRSIESRKRIAKRITEVIAEEADVDPEWITIQFVETSEDRIARGGVLLSERMDKSRD